MACVFAFDKFPASDANGVGEFDAHAVGDLFQASAQGGLAARLNLSLFPNSCPHWGTT